MEKNIWIPYTHLFAKGSPHRVLQGILKEVHHDHVIVQRASQPLPTEDEGASKSVEGQQDRVDFDYLVIATGSSMPAPGKMPHVSSSAEGLTNLHRIRQDIEASQRILVIGGGACGVEFASEMKYAYPNKHVTLVHGGKHLVDYPGFPQSFKDETLKYLESHDVRVILGEKVEGVPGLSKDSPVQRQTTKVQLKHSGKTLESDLQILTSGITVDTSFLETLRLPSSPMSTSLAVTTASLDGTPATEQHGAFHFSSLIDEKTHQIRVFSTTQLAHPAFPNIFVVGDISTADPVPTALAAKAAGEVAGRNITRLMMTNPSSNLAGCPGTHPHCGPGGRSSGLEEYRAQSAVMVLAMNPTGGVSNVPVLGTHFGNNVAWVVKTRDMFVHRYWNEMNLSPPSSHS
ncbi:Apoptosis-inducing factor 2 [Actinomortierella ambigua]|uniref:Apoptosis-inducing factor 2 n=1 Tax=Actinomortierella ambigua TaxID=1343610 RepID=A0A9P6PZZ2_9FUNG|nr:Apoptosis-inducing factor 2 [Actinomortierella ambigua]